MKFCDNLRNLRIQRNLTQAELADSVGKRQATISAWEKGTREPDFDSIQELATFFGVPMSALLPSEDDIDASYVSRVAESLHRNPKLRLLFDRSKYLSDSDLDTVIAVVNAINKERVHDD